ncbi:MAG: signal recognition particle-docking protein FtsY [Acidimicrobiales bacterium]|jgi:fused signal recognition particle receptor
MVLVIVLVVIAVVLLASAGLVLGKRSPRRGPALGAGAPPLARAPEPPVPRQEPAPTTVAPPVPEDAPVAEAPAQEHAQLLQEPLGRPALRDRLGRARGLLAGYLDGVRGRKGIDDATFEELEEALILADVGITTTTRILNDLRAKVRSGAVSATDPAALLQALQADLVSMFEGDDGSLSFGAGEGPTVWLFVGVNGVGKTTTIGKLALAQSQAGRSVVLAAGDTFRAAAGEQLESWADRAQARIVRGSDGADPSSVIFDAVQHAASRGAGLVLADTAGRLHTKVNLMDELRKVRRVAERPPGQLTEVLLVLDATTGQNGVVQARQFTDTVGVTGIVLTKLDGTAKGGVVLAIRSELGLPIKLVGVGEGPADLVPFDPAEFVAALFG